MQKWRPWTNMPTHAYRLHRIKDSIVFTFEAHVSHAVTGEVIHQGGPDC
jgi:hypothetical protein